MTTILQICTRALRRLGVISTLDTPSSEDARSALDALNEMFAFWRAKGIDTLAPTFALADTLVFFVPPSGDPIGTFEDRGSWDASINSPSLASSTGTQGHVYKVSVAGATVLNDVTSWAVNDYAVFDGTAWLKGKSSARHEAGVIALLAMRLCDEFGIAPKPTLVQESVSAFYALQADYVKPPKAGFDAALLDTAAGRYQQ